MRSIQVFSGNQLDMLAGFQLIGVERALLAEGSRLKLVDISPGRFGPVIRSGIQLSQWLKQRTSGVVCYQNDQPESINGSLSHRFILDMRTVDLDTRIAKTSVYPIGWMVAMSTRESEKAWSAAFIANRQKWLTRGGNT